MNKIWLIIKREYLAKVKKKTFILSTILFPVLYFALIFGAGYLSDKGGKQLKIAIIDSSGYFTKEKIDAANKADSSNILTNTTGDPASFRQNLAASGYDGFIVIPADTNWQAGFKNLTMLANRTLGGESSYAVSQKLNKIWDDIKNEKLGITKDQKSKLEESKVGVRAVNMKDESANSGTSNMIGVVAAILVYIMLLLYGSQVMMGVTEEKTNRIAEVMISSVKPFQLMLGKIIGIGMVAFTQILLWISFILIIYNVMGAGNAGPVDGIISGLQKVFSTVNVPQILFFLVFYLMGGFFFYSSLFAAAGSAVNEDMREAQSLSFPLMLPIIFAMMMIGAVLKDPTGPVAVWGSIIPFSSPIIMMIRIPFGVPSTVPWWQLGLSMAALIGGFILTTWFAAKIYRTGILMYGKKASWKEMVKWAFRK